MAKLYDRNGIWYVTYAVNGRRFKVSTGTSDKKLAQIKLSDIELKLFKGELGVPEKKPKQVTVAEFFRRYIDFAHNNYAVGSFAGDLSRIRIMQEFFARKGVKYIGAITPGIYEEFDSTVLKGRKPKTRSNYLGRLKTMLNYAVSWGLLESNPLAKVKKPKVPETYHFFKKEEVETLIKNAGEPLRFGIIILVYTGLRRSELYNVRWRDVDFKDKSIRVWPYDEFVPKGKRIRTIPLNPKVFEALKSLKERSDGSEPVYRPYENIHTLRKNFKKLVKGLGMRGTLHDLRHTFASHLAMAGVPIPVIQNLLGHTDIRTTMKYAHLSPDQNHIAINKLPY